MTFEEWENKSEGDSEGFQKVMHDIARKSRSLGIEVIVLYRVEDKLSNTSEYGVIRGCDTVVAMGLLSIGSDLICEYEEDDQ